MRQYENFEVSGKGDMYVMVQRCGVLHGEDDSISNRYDLPAGSFGSRGGEVEEMSGRGTLHVGYTSHG